MKQKYSLIQILSSYSRHVNIFSLSFTFILLVLFSAKSNAQTRPHMNHYLFNYYLVNPAVAGIEDFVMVNSSVRSQWNSLEGAPETLALTVHGNIVSKAKQNPANPIKPKNEIQNHTIDLDGYNARPHHGVGGLVLADRVGPFSKVQFNASYAYHIPLSKKYRLAAGLSLGFINNRLDESRITLYDPDDVAINGEQYYSVNPDLGIGMWFYSRNIFVGLSGGQLIKYNQLYGDFIQTGNESYQNFVATGGYKFYPRHDIIVTPSLAVRWMQPNPVVIDYNLMITFLSRASLALTYRSSSAFVVGARFIATPIFELGYSFDYGTSTIDRYNDGSHELYLGLRLRNKHKILCPVNL